MSIYNNNVIPMNYEHIGLLHDISVFPGNQGILDYTNESCQAIQLAVKLIMTIDMLGNINAI